MLRFSLALAMGASVMTGCDGSGVRIQSTRPIPVTTADTGGAGGGPAVGMCDRIALDGSCYSYLGPGWIEADAIAGCNNGTYVSGARCMRTQDTIGHCAESVNGPLEVWTYFYRGAYWDDGDEATLEGNCELVGGLWF